MVGTALRVFAIVVVLGIVPAGVFAFRDTVARAIIEAHQETAADGIVEEILLKAARPDIDV